MHSHLPLAGSGDSRVSIGVPGSGEDLLVSTNSTPAPASRREPIKSEYQRETLNLASVAHELKTPISIMSGYTHLLLSEKPGPLVPAQREILMEMETNRVRLQQIINDFLNYSAIASGNLKLNTSLNDLHRCLGETCEIWAPRFQRKLVSFYR